MRSLDRNKQLVYYKNYTGMTASLDDDGYETGEYTKSYSNVASKYLNVSASKGSYATDRFGENANYSKTIVTNDMSCSIAENSVLWVGLGAISTYATTTSYSVGDYCIYSGTIYICITATTGTWVSANWTEVPYNYIVTSVAKSINSITYAIDEVKVNG